MARKKKKRTRNIHAGTWYESTELGDECCFDTHCPDCEPNGNCDACDTIDGRFMERVNDYASTCDGPCMQLTHHDLLTMDPMTQLGYCDRCIPTLPDEIKERLNQSLDDYL